MKLKKITIKFLATTLIAIFAFAPNVQALSEVITVSYNDRYISVYEGLSSSRVIREEVLAIEGVPILLTTAVYANAIVNSASILDSIDSDLVALPSGFSTIQEDLPNNFIQNAISQIEDLIYNERAETIMELELLEPLSPTTQSAFFESGFVRHSQTSSSNNGVHVQHEFGWQRITEAVGISMRHQVLLTNGIIRGFSESGNAEVIRLDQSVTRHGLNFGVSFGFPWSVAVSPVSGTSTQNWVGSQVHNAFFVHIEHWDNPIHGSWNNLLVASTLVSINSSVHVILRNPNGTTIGHRASIETRVAKTGVPTRH